MKLKLISVAVFAIASSSAMAMDDIKNTDNMNASTSGLYNAGNTYEGLVNADSRFSFDMLNNFYVMNQQKKLLKNRQYGVLKNNTINLGGKLELFANTTSKSIDVTGRKQETSIIMPTADVQITGVSGNWLTGYFHMQAKAPITSGRISASSDLRVQDGMFLVGNLDESPVYFFGGLGTVNFGQFTSPSTINFNLTRGAFMATAGNVGVGYDYDYYDNYNYNVTFTAMNGKGLSDTNSGNRNSNTIALNNYAIAAEFTGDFLEDAGFGFRVGAGFIDATGFTADGFTGTDITDSNSFLQGGVVSAWNLNAGLNFGDLDNQIQINGEITRTTKGVKGSSINSGLLPTGAGGYDAAQLLGLVFPQFTNGDNVTGMSLNADYSTQLFDSEKETVFYTMYDGLYQGCNNNVDGNGYWTVGLGARTNLLATLWLGASYNLVGQSGPTTGSEDNGKDHVVALDATVYF